MESPCHPNDIPIWWNGTQRWMTGLTKRTTCDDVIYALLYSSGLHETDSTDNYAIFEKWREVERPLSARTKLLKVWTFWGQEQATVKLSMRSLDDYFLPGESSLYLRSKRRHRRSSQHKTRHSNHERCVAKRGCVECSRLRSLEQLVKLVVSQERKIQELSGRIHRTDRQVDNHEARIHQHRCEQNGLDYVQNSYLNSHSSSSNSSIDSSTFTTIDLKKVKAIFPDSSWHELEEIIRMSDDLAHIEQRLVSEQATVKELTPDVNRMMHEVGMAEEQETNGELEEIKVQMVRTLTNHITNEYREKELDRKSMLMQNQLEAKMEVLRQLQNELTEIDRQMNQSAGSHQATNNEHDRYSTDEVTPIVPGAFDDDRIASFHHGNKKPRGPMARYPPTNHLVDISVYNTHSNNLMETVDQISNPSDYRHNTPYKNHKDDHHNQNTYIRKSNPNNQRGDNSKRPSSSYGPVGHSGFHHSTDDKNVIPGDVIAWGVTPTATNDVRNRGRLKDIKRGSRLRSRSEERGRSSGSMGELYHEGQARRELKRAMGWDEEKGLRYSPAILNQYGLDPARSFSNPKRKNSLTSPYQTETSQVKSQTYEEEVKPARSSDTVMGVTPHGEESWHNERDARANKGQQWNNENKVLPPLHKHSAAATANTGLVRSFHEFGPSNNCGNVPDMETMPGKKVEGVFEKNVRASPSSSSSLLQKVEMAQDNPEVARDWGRSPRDVGMAPFDPDAQIGSVVTVKKYYTMVGKDLSGDSDSNTCGSDHAMPKEMHTVVNGNEKDNADSVRIATKDLKVGHHLERKQRVHFTNSEINAQHSNLMGKNINQSNENLSTTYTSQGHCKSPRGDTSIPANYDNRGQIDDVNTLRRNLSRFDCQTETMPPQRGDVTVNSDQHNTSHVSSPMKQPRAPSSAYHSNNHAGNQSERNVSVHTPSHKTNNSYQTKNDSDSPKSSDISDHHESHSGRGALFHIINHKLNKTKQNEHPTIFSNPRISSSLSMDNIQCMDYCASESKANVRLNLRYYNSSSSSCSSSSTTTINASSSSTETLTPHSRDSQIEKDNSFVKSGAIQQSRSIGQQISTPKSKGIPVTYTSTDTPRQKHETVSNFDGVVRCNGERQAEATHPNISGNAQYVTSHYGSKSGSETSCQNDSRYYMRDDNASSMAAPNHSYQTQIYNGSARQNFSENTTGQIKPYHTPNHERQQSDDNDARHKSSGISYSSTTNGNSPNHNNVTNLSTPRTSQPQNAGTSSSRHRNSTFESHTQPNQPLSSRSQNSTASDMLNDIVVGSPGGGNRRGRVNPHFCDIDQSKKSHGETKKLTQNSQMSYNVAIDPRFQNGFQKPVMMSGEEFGNRKVNFSSLNDTQDRSLATPGPNNTSMKGTTSSSIQRIVDVKNIVSQRDSLKVGFIESTVRSRNIYKESLSNGHTVIKSKLEDSNDSNSDTGLSSMHSDETANLETLV